MEQNQIDESEITEKQEKNNVDELKDTEKQENNTECNT